MKKNLLKRYNDFIKINENQEIETPVETPTETPTETPDKRRERYNVPTPSVNPDPLAEAGEEGVEDNLEYLHDTLEGSELMNNILKYKGHEITLPSETNQFEVDGVRRIKKDGNKLVSTSSAEDVIEYLNNPEAQSEAKGAQEKRVQAQAQRVAQAQTETPKFEEVSADELMRQLEDDHDGSKSDILTNKTEKTEFETQTGEDPEAEALSGEKVDVEKTGTTKNESKSYKSNFRIKL
jgi:preprotein translocase subunit SecD